MQTRDYDCYIYIASRMGFRLLNDNGDTIFIDKETDGYCNMYANNIAVSFLHSMNKKQINAIHYFENNHPKIFEVLVNHLSNQFKLPKDELGFKCINILDQFIDDFSIVEYIFIKANKEKIKVKMFKSILVNEQVKKGFLKNQLSN
ncbi:hypothetical protein DS884_13685 [Tenacibaculum sp. E3R01]|uniref:hypothetical protein n=1 Tax=Tenacibaculum sp. E3R01 TaxID=2267227 RepID=UPI000DEB4179|nr:hypothetical protein [Tenacibaculum sp. E3R01]RBW56513.1 hypothetical protein DS884_13685 [Tenacibaculum sp. E3R01]